MSERPVYGGKAEMLDRVVIAETAQGHEHFVGVVKAYADFPTFQIDTGDGPWASWAAHLCRHPTADEEVAYWRERALAAERGDEE